MIGGVELLLLLLNNTYIGGRDNNNNHNNVRPLDSTDSRSGPP